MNNYNIFISWSGDRSKMAATALRNWLPKVIQSAKPWMSETDIDKGTRGLDEIGKVLEGQNFGICCLTSENLQEPWILFEAGALSKSFEINRLWTFLLGGLQPREVKMPLGMFQATMAEQEDTRKLVRAINKAVSETPVSEVNLDEVFDAMWPKLEEQLKALPPSKDAAPPKRKQEDMVAEILEFTRAEANRKGKLEQYEHIFEELLPLLKEWSREAMIRSNPPMFGRTEGLLGLSDLYPARASNLLGRTKDDSKNS